MIKLLTTFVLCSLGLLAQTGPFDQVFSYTKTTALVAATEVVTVQHAATTNKSARMISVYLYSSVASIITMERTGTAATATAGTVLNVNPNNTFVQTTTCTVYSGSDVGTGTVIDKFYLPAGGFITVDLSPYQLPAGIADNITWRVNSITGTVVISAKWREI